MRFSTRRHHKGIQNIFIRITILILVLGIFFFFYGIESNEDYDLFGTNDWEEEPTLPICYMLPSYMGSVKRMIDVTKSPKESDLEELFNTMQSGGFWTPNICKPRYSTGLVFIQPNQNESNYLMLLLRNLIPFMQRTRIEFRIIVLTEDSENGTFSDDINTGLLYNVAVRYLQTLGISCFVFHDIHLVPLHDLNIYKCREKAPVQLISSLQEDSITTSFFGVVAVNLSQFLSINGFPNIPNPEDEITKRFMAVKQDIRQIDSIIGKYWSLKNFTKVYAQKSKVPEKGSFYRDALQMNSDGFNGGILNNHVTHVKLIEKKLYTNIRVTVKQ